MRSSTNIFEACVFGVRCLGVMCLSLELREGFHTVGIKGSRRT